MALKKRACFQMYLGLVLIKYSFTKISITESLVDKQAHEQTVLLRCIRVMFFWKDYLYNEAISEVPEWMYSEFFCS